MNRTSCCTPMHATNRVAGDHSTQSMSSCSGAWWHRILNNRSSARWSCSVLAAPLPSSALSYIHTPPSSQSSAWLVIASTALSPKSSLPSEACTKSPWPCPTVVGSRP